MVCLKSISLRIGAPTDPLCPEEHHLVYYNNKMYHDDNLVIRAHGGQALIKGVFTELNDVAVTGQAKRCPFTAWIRVRCGLYSWIADCMRERIRSLAAWRCRR